MHQIKKINMNIKKITIAMSIALISIGNINAQGNCNKLINNTLNKYILIL